MKIAVEKVLAYLTIKQNNEVYLLVYEHPITKLIEVVRGTVEHSNLQAEILREIKEEYGLDADIFQDIQLFATHIFEVPSGHYGEGPLQQQKHYAFRLTLKKDQQLANEWLHTVTGTGLDNGHVHRCFWLPLKNAQAIMTPRTAYFAMRLVEVLVEE